MLNDVRPIHPTVSVPEARQKQTAKSVWLERLLHLDTLEAWRDSVASSQAEIARLKGLCGVLATLSATKGQHEPVNPEDLGSVARVLEDRLECVESQLSETLGIFIGLIGDIREILATDTRVVVDGGNRI